MKKSIHKSVIHQKTFNREWMQCVNPDLLLRWWRQRKEESILIYHSIYGITYEVRQTIFGEVWSIQ